LPIAKIVSQHLSTAIAANDKGAGKSALNLCGVIHWQQAVNGQQLQEIHA